MVTAEQYRFFMVYNADLRASLVATPDGEAERARLKHTCFFEIPAKMINPELRERLVELAMSDGEFPGSEGVSFID